MEEVFVIFEGVLAPEKSALSHLIAKFLYEHRELYENSDVLELGTGSGCIAVSLAKSLPQAKITATDISEKALAVARENAELNENADTSTKNQVGRPKGIPQSEYQKATIKP